MRVDPARTSIRGGMLLSDVSFVAGTQSKSSLTVTFENSTNVPAVLAGKSYELIGTLEGSGAVVWTAAVNGGSSEIDAAYLPRL